MPKKKQKIEWSPEKQRESELRDMRRNLHLIPEPTYTFNLGDSVTIGNLQDVVVSQVLDNNRIYEITYSHTDSNYGRPIKRAGSKMYVPWTSIRKPFITTDSFIQNEDLRMNYSQTHLASLLSKAYHFGVDFDPEYQRGYVWELSDKVALIDSIFHNVDIGKFAFIRDDTYTQTYLYQVLDGKQRIRAILDYFEDRFEYKGRLFSDLSGRDQSYFESYSVNVAEVGRMKEEQIYRYFLMLNTSGKAMSQEHLDRVRQRLAEITTE